MCFMPLWVALFSNGPRRTAHCRHVTKIPSPQLLLFPALKNRDACNPFRIRSYENCRVTSFRPNTFLFPPAHFSPLYSSSFFSDSYALFCTILQSRKTQLISFQAIPNSFAKTPRVGVGSESLTDSIGFPPSHPLKSPRCPQASAKWTGQSRNHYD